MANMEIVTFRLDPFIKEKVEQEADARGWDKSSMYRHIVKDWFERHHEPRETIIETPDGKRVRVRYRMAVGGSGVDFSSVEVL